MPANPAMTYEEARLLWRKHVGHRWVPAYAVDPLLQRAYAVLHKAQRLEVTIKER